MNGLTGIHDPDDPAEALAVGLDRAGVRGRRGEIPLPEATSPRDVLTARPAAKIPNSSSLIRFAETVMCPIGSTALSTLIPVGPSSPGMSSSAPLAAKVLLATTLSSMFWNGVWL